MNKNPLMLGGVMTYCYDDKGRETADFQNCDPGVLVQPFVGKCKVQRVRDGNLYVTRLRNPHEGSARGCRKTEEVSIERLIALNGKLHLYRRGRAQESPPRY